MNSISGIMKIPIQKPFAFALSAYSRQATKNAYFIGKLLVGIQASPCPHVGVQALACLRIYLSAPLSSKTRLLRFLPHEPHKHFVQGRLRLIEAPQANSLRK